MIAGFSLINTLGDGVTTIDLADDIDWADEFAWSPIARKLDYSLTGALIVKSSTKLAGRPITLQSQADSGFLPRSTIVQLNTWAKAGTQLAITIRGQSFSVIFDPAASPAIQSAPVVYYSDPLGTDWYSATLKFIEAII